MNQLCDLTIRELNAQLRAHEITPLDIVRSVITRAQEREPVVNGYIARCWEQAEAQAAKLASPASDASPLYGIPMAVKDNICTKAIRTTCGSQILANFVSPYDAFAVERLKAAQAVITGKTNMDEFAMGASNETSFFGAVRNPHDRIRVPGGSSGGSAAVVSYGGAIAALGSDTGGSVRQPAAFCGIVGLKPTYGRISRYGLVAFASSLDQIGVLARTVTDAAIVLSVVAGRDPHDSTSVSLPVPDYARFSQDIRQLRIGIPAQVFSAPGLDSDVGASVRREIDEAQNAGMTIVDIQLPHLDSAVPAYYLICMAEASSNLARYDGVRYGLRTTCATLDEQYKQTRGKGFGSEVKRRILLGTFGLSKGSIDEYYAVGQKTRTLIRQDFAQAFKQCDVIATPTAPTTAFKLGDKVHDPLAMYLADVFTAPVSLAGLPAISVPCRTCVQGLPVGLQIIGKPFAEETMLAVARSFEHRQ